ncbi:MAG: ATP-binding cassette domain-containing protein [Bacteroidia bacterium]|nr:ATP-binding cassette domain-containing protein [Bacteroidia bacterium]
MENNNQPFSPLQRFFRLLRVERQEIIIIYLYAIFYGLVNLSLPLGIQAIINLITVGMISTSWIVLVVFVILGIALSGWLQVMQLAVSEKIQQKIFTRSAFEFAYRIPRLNLSSVDRKYVPELVNRFFDTLSVQKGLSKILIDFSSAALQVIFGLILLSLYHPFFIFFGILLVLIVFLIFRFTGPEGMRTSLVESKYKYEVVHWLEELARAMQTFKLAGKTPLPMERTDQLVGGYLKSRKAHFRVLILQYINMVGFKIVVASGLLILGGLLVIRQQMNVGQFVAAEIIIILVLASVEKLILGLETIYDVLTALEKLGGVTDIPLERDQGFMVEQGSTQRGLKISLDRVSYRFPDAEDDILKEITLEIHSGERIVLTGLSGSGKSLLLNVIAGLYEDFRGSIAYNDIPVGSLDIAALRACMGDSLDKEIIFKGTILENITVGRPGIGFEESAHICQVLGLTNYLKTLPQGLYTPLLPEGRQLPRSIVQKIILARIFAGNPRLILLEEVPIHLEKSDREKFLKYLLDPAHAWTVIAATHDPEFARSFDRIIGLENGRLVGQGSYEAVQNEPWFRKIVVKN